jgi:hypothetical protein
MKKKESNKTIEKKSPPLSVLHVVTIMYRTGIETMLMNYFRSIDRSKIQFDFLYMEQK